MPSPWVEGQMMKIRQVYGENKPSSLFGWMVCAMHAVSVS